MEERKIIKPTLLNIAHFSFVRSKIIVATDNNPAYTILQGSGFNGSIQVTGLNPHGGEDSSAETDQANVGAQNAAVNAERPDLVPGRSAKPTGKRVVNGLTYVFDPTAFQPQAPGVFGNLGRNTLMSIGVRELDMGVAKNTKIGEHSGLLIRADAFNLTNHTNLGFPSANLFGATQAGQITSTATTSRQIQFSAKFAF